MATKTFQTTPCVANSLQADPLEDEPRQRRRRHMALIVCRGASTPAAWAIAERLAKSWGLSCSALGVPAPPDPDGGRRRVGVQNLTKPDIGKT